MNSLINNHAKKSHCTDSDVLKNLIDLSAPIEQIKESLKAIQWNSDTSVLMSKNSVIQVLSRFINDEISHQTLEKWANLVESREDIEFDPICPDDIKTLIFNIANPELQGLFTKDVANSWLQKLGRS